jgi:hypothetical protein
MRISPDRCGRDRIAVTVHLTSRDIPDLTRRSMPARNFSLTPEQNAFIKDLMRKGE